MKALTKTDFNFPGQKVCTTEKYAMFTTSMVKSWLW